MTESYVLPYSKYPDQIGDWRDKKKRLWYQGHIEMLNSNMVSVVGTRSPSEEGIKTAKEVTSIAVSEGFCVVSGMAKGIDTVAHSMALGLQGKTIAVMGTYIDDCYPKENFGLKEEIAKNGLVLSQFSYSSEISRYNFPKRNELMAQLSTINIVIEAGEKSGTKYQVKKALHLNKKIVFFNHLIDQKCAWVSQSLSHEDCFLMEDISDFGKWIVGQKEDGGEKEGEAEAEVEAEVVPSSPVDNGKLEQRAT